MHSTVQQSKPRHRVGVALVLLLVLSLVTAVQGQKGEASKQDVQIMMLQQQVNELDRQIAEAEMELRSVPDFNWACCIGWNFFFPIGTVVWLLTDVQAHKDAKSTLRAKIDRLQSDKRNLQNQIMILQSGK